MQNYDSKFKSDLKDRCYKFSLAAISLVDTLPNKKAAITDQLLRAAMFVGANLIEGSAASSRLEYKKFYEIALKSANETKYWWCLPRNSKLAETKKAQILLNEATELANMLAVGVIKLKGKTF